jgi:hypothetical protein
MTYPAALFGLAFGLEMVALCIVYEARQSRVKLMFLVIAAVCLVALVAFGIWQLLGPWPLIVWNPW